MAGMVVDQLPSPLQLTPERVEKLMCSSAKTFDSFPRQTQLLKEGGSVCMSGYLSVYLSVLPICLSCLSVWLFIVCFFFVFFSPDFIACSPDPNAPTVVFISKLFVVDSSTLPQHQSR